MDSKTKFLQVYANLPLNLRSEIILVIDREPVTWNSAWIEIDNETLKGKKILEKLIELGIIK